MVASYNGWAANPDPSAIGINTKFTVLGTKPFKNGGFAGGVKSGDVEKIFSWLIIQLHNNVEPMGKDSETGQLGYGCWGYEYRANVNNPSTMSCHASGTAIDYNAHLHRNGTSVGPSGGGGWTAIQYKKIQLILGALRGVVRWLTSNDPMHFEINGSALEVAAVARLLTGSTGTPQTPDSAPTPPATADPVPTTPEEEEDDEDMMQTIQVVDTPVIYAYGPGKFYGLGNMETYKVGVDAGFWKPVRPVNQRELDVTRALALGLVDGQGVISTAQ